MTPDLTPLSRDTKNAVENDRDAVAPASPLKSIIMAETFRATARAAAAVEGRYGPRCQPAGVFYSAFARQMRGRECRVRIDPAGDYFGVNAVNSAVCSASEREALTRIDDPPIAGKRMTQSAAVEIVSLDKAIAR